MTDTKVRDRDMADRMELYKAVKWQVVNFFADHGMSVPELWAVVNHRMIGVEAIDYISIDYISIDLSDWWRDMCLDDYRNRRVA